MWNFFLEKLWIHWWRKADVASKIPSHNDFGNVVGAIGFSDLHGQRPKFSVQFGEWRKALEVVEKIRPQLSERQYITVKVLLLEELFKELVEQQQVGTVQLKLTKIFLFILNSFGFLILFVHLDPIFPFHSI